MRLARVAVAIAGLLAVAAVAFAYGTAQADHQFPDVPTNHAFHAQIGSGYDARCYTGFTNGTFQPGAAPTRGQFAYWLNNCVPRTGLRSGVGTNTGTEQISPSQLLTTTGSDPAGTSQVNVQVQVKATSGATGSCPCRLLVTARRDGNQFETTEIDIPTNNTIVHGSLMDQLDLAAATQYDFTVAVNRTQGTAPIDWDVNLLVTASPFGPDGLGVD